MRPSSWRLRAVPLACAALGLSAAALAQSTSSSASASTPSAPPAAASAPAASASAAQALPVVSVKARSERLPAPAPGGKVATGAQLGILGEVEAMDSPFSTSAYTAEGIADQQSTTVGTVLRGDPSVRATTNEGHLVENLKVRGFSVGSSAMAIQGLYGLAPEQNTPTEPFERVEVLKGPGAMIMGLPPTGDVGGAVNMVFKRAGRDPLTRVTASFADESTLGLHADIGRRFGEEGRLGVRFNGAYAGGETWLEGQTKRREVAHVGMDYRGDGWRAEADVYSLATKARHGSPMQLVLTGTWTEVPDAPDGSTNFFHGEDVYSNTSTHGAILRGEYDLNRDWTLHATAGRARHAYDGFIFGTRPVLAATDAATGRATGTVYNSWGQYDTLNTELGLKGRFATGEVRHQLNVALQRMTYEGGSRGNGTASIVSNLYDPVAVTMPAGKDASTYTAYNDDVYTSLAVADTLSLAQGRVQLTLGLRHQQIRQKLAGYDEAAVTPLAGIVLKPWGEHLSLYGNYVEGLSAGTTVGSTYSNAGETFAPYRSRQVEAGVKWRQGELTQTVALFQISKPSTIEVDGALRLDGEQRNRGLEWGLSGQLMPRLTLQGGAAYTQAIQTRTASNANEGNDAVGVPRWTANLGAEHELAALPGLAINGRINHTGTQWVNAANTLQLPASTTLDVGARYAMRMGTQPVTWRATITNLANKAYWDNAWGENRLSLGAPRSVKLSATLDF